MERAVSSQSFGHGEGLKERGGRRRGRRAVQR
jgi:hypothetical protein